MPSVFFLLVDLNIVTDLILCKVSVWLLLNYFSSLPVKFPQVAYQIAFNLFVCNILVLFSTMTWVIFWKNFPFQSSTHLIDQKATY